MQKDQRHAKCLGVALGPRGLIACASDAECRLFRLPVVAWDERPLCPPPPDLKLGAQIMCRADGMPMLATTGNVCRLKNIPVDDGCSMPLYKCFPEALPDEDFPSMYLTKWGKQMGQVAGDTSECSNGRLVLRRLPI